MLILNMVTKNEVIEAYQKKHRKRSLLLYSYFKDLFDQGYTAKYIAKKISEDLEVIPISENAIRLMNVRLKKLADKKNVEKKVSKNSTINKHENNENKNVVEKSVFRDADELPPKPLKGLSGLRIDDL